MEYSRVCIWAVLPQERVTTVVGNQTRIVQYSWSITIETVPPYDDPARVERVVVCPTIAREVTIIHLRRHPGLSEPGAAAVVAKAQNAWPGKP